MTWPDTRFADAGGYADAYFARLQEAAASVDRERLGTAAALLSGVYESGGTLFACGNGGSAAIANQLVCDHGKGLQADSGLMPRVCSLSATIEMITAIGNDSSYDEVFVFQLRSLARPGDALLTVSSSGDSENIVRAARWARENRIVVIAMTGFSGGRSADIADVHLHVTADNYGVIEDVHQSLTHILAQFIRQAHMNDDAISARVF